ALDPRKFLPDAKTGQFLSVPLPTVVRTMPSFRSFQYLLQPTARQAGALEHLLGVQCEAYNSALEERREAWKKGVRITRFDQFAQGWKLKASDHRLYLQGIGHVKIKLHRSLKGVPKTLHVRRQGRRFTATIQCADVPAQPLALTHRHAGFDLGVATLAASSDGELFENPRHLARGTDA